MSGDEDTELRDLVIQTLEANGTLGKIKAQLRASVFLALEEQDKVKEKSPFLNHDLQKFLDTRDGILVTSLVREFLEHFHLDSTLAVFEPEVGFREENAFRRTAISRELEILENDSSKKSPLMSEVLRRLSSHSPGRRGSRAETVIHRTNGNSSIGEEDLNPSYLDEARAKFEKYDVDKNGSIDKDELRSLFCDLLPGFPPTMIERYVNDEFRAIDVDFNSKIDFPEFLEMYKRLFVLCRGVVHRDVAEILSPRRSGAQTRIPKREPEPKEESMESNHVKATTKSNTRLPAVGAADSKQDRSRSHSSVFDKDDSLDLSESIDELLQDNNNKKLNGFRMEAKKSVDESPRPASLSSLDDLPPLPGVGAQRKQAQPTSPSTVTTSKPTTKAFDRSGDGHGLDDLRIDFKFYEEDKSGDMKYDDDFDEFDDRGGKTTGSISARSDKRDQRSLNRQASLGDDGDEIQEEIAEEFSLASDVSRSPSRMDRDDVTKDVTLSDNSLNGDYMEDVKSP